MSSGFTISVDLGGTPGSTDGHDSYRVVRHGKCTYVQGPIPIDDLMRLTKGKKSYVMSTYLAAKYDATVFFGPEDEIDALTELLKESNRESFARAIAANEDPVAAWLRFGDVGASSEFMCNFLSGRNVGMNNPRTPADYGDFQRCERMLCLVPGLREKLPMLLQVSGYEGLVPAWDQLAAFVAQPELDDYVPLVGQQLEEFNVLFKGALGRP